MLAGAARTILVTARPVDWLTAATLLLLAWFEIWVEPIFQTGMPGPRLPLTLFAFVALAPLVARKGFPLASLIVMSAGFLGVGIVGDPDQSSFVLLLGLLVATYSVAAHAEPRNAVIGAGVVVVLAVAYQLTLEQEAIVDFLVPVLFLAAAWIVGKEVHRQRQRASELAERSTLLARAHELEVRSAIAAERTRIARELHDVVAHAISVMGIQAGAARRTLEPGQAAQRDALLDVERLGREALDEMQRMLSVLRSGDAHQGADPLPDVTRLPALAAEARRAGIDVELDIVGEPEALPAGLQLTVYRIVQEALTNVIKHADARRVRVTIAPCADMLEVTVTDDGTDVTGEPKAGHGLLGMRERVGVRQGTLYTGPGEGGGFVVRARLPLRGGP